jgi:hypothetical protein
MVLIVLDAVAIANFNDLVHHGQWIHLHALDEVCADVTPLIHQGRFSRASAFIVAFQFL